MKLNLTEKDILEFNKILKEENMNFMQLCKKLNVAKSTLQSKLKKAGFKYNKELKVITLEEIRTIDSITIGKNKATKDNQCEDNINILKEIEFLKRRVQALESNNNAITPNLLNIDIDTNENYNYRTIKLYSSIGENFDNFCKKYKHLSKQDLLNQAINDFVDKYK